MPLSDIRPALRSFLLADVNISAVVADRVFPLVLPQGQTQPSIVYSRISGIGDHTTSGPSGLARPRFQIDAYAQSADDADALALMIKSALDGFAGLMGTITVQGVFYETERDDFYPEINMHRASRDYFIFFEER